MATIDSLPGHGSDIQTVSTPRPGDVVASAWERNIVLLYLVVVAVGLMYFLVRLWPEPGESAGTWNKQVVVFWSSSPIEDVSDDVRLLLLVIVAGGLGSFIHAATSFVDYVGNRNFVRSWALWYVMRPLIGAALALVLYVAVRGGLLTASAGGDSVSPFGVTALAFLAGMFSKQATDKLSELFTTLFKTSDDGDAVRKDKLHKAPKVLSVEPTRLSVGDGGVELLVNGSGFERASIVRLNGQPRETRFINTSRLAVTMKPTDTSSAGTLTLVVDNATGVDSPPVTLTVT